MLAQPNLVYCIAEHKVCVNTFLLGYIQSSKRISLNYTIIYIAFMEKNSAKLNDINPTTKIYKDIQIFFDMKIEEVIDKRSWDIPIIEINNNVMDLLAILSTNDHVWVIENRKNKKLVGVITEHDIMNFMQPPKANLFFGTETPKFSSISLFDTVELLLVDEPITCFIDENVKDILHKMETYSIRRLPVIKPTTSEIIGEISIHQLIRKYYDLVKPICELCPQNEGLNLKSKKS